jgi:hypothetical protein
MIEFLPPRDGAFGDRDAADFVGLDGGDDGAWGDDEPPRSRWLTALAVLGVTGLLAGGVIAAAPWDATDTAPPETTAAPTTTVARPPSLRDLETEPTLPRDWPTTPAGWIPAEGSRYQVTYAFSTGEGFVMDPSWGTSVAVYASEGELTRTSNRWLAIEAFPSGVWNQQIRPSSVTTTTGERRVLVSTSADGVVTVDVEMFPDTGEAPVRISGFGVDLGTLLTVAAEVDLEWNGNTRRLGFDAVDASGALDGLTPRVTDGVMRLGFDAEHGLPLAATDLVDDTGRRWARVSVLRQNADEALLSELLRRRPVDVSSLPLELQRRLDDLARRGLPIELFRSFDGPALLARAQLTSDTVLVATADGTSDERDVIDVIESVQPASDDEWVELLVQSSNGLLDSPELVSEAEDITPLGNGPDWDSNVMRGTFTIGSASGGVWEPFTHGQGPELVEYRSFDVAYLRATTTFPDEARLIVVTQDGRDRQRAKLIEIPGTGVLAAVVEVDPTLPYTVAWVDQDEEPVDGPVDAASSLADAER